MIHSTELYSHLYPCQNSKSNHYKYTRSTINPYRSSIAILTRDLAHTVLYKIALTRFTKIHRQLLTSIHWGTVTCCTGHLLSDKHDNWITITQSLLAFSDFNTLPHLRTPFVVARGPASHEYHDYKPFLQSAQRLVLFSWYLGIVYVVSQLNLWGLRWDWLPRKESTSTTLFGVLHFIGHCDMV